MVEDDWLSWTPTVLKVSAAEWDLIQTMLDEPATPNENLANLIRQART